MKQLNIKNPEAFLLAKELSELTGESITQTVIGALQERVRMYRNRNDQMQFDIIESANAIVKELSKHPILDDRHPDELLYDEHGLPK